MRALNVKTGEVIIISDKITIEDPISSFLNDSIVAKPASGCIKLYNLHTRKFEGTLLTFNKEFGFLQFSLSEDKSKAAVLLQGGKDPIYNPVEDKLKSRVELKIVDLKNHKEYVVEHYDYISGESVYAIGDILWHGEDVIYSYQSNLYYYKLGQPKALLLTKYMETYALNKDELIFVSIEPKSEYYTFSKFNLANQAMASLGPQDESIRKLGMPTPIQLYTVPIHKTRYVTLRTNTNKYYTMDARSKFVPQAKLLLYKDKGLSIHQSVTAIPEGSSTVDKYELLITSS